MHENDPLTNFFDRPFNFRADAPNPFGRIHGPCHACPSQHQCSPVPPNIANKDNISLKEYCQSLNDYRQGVISILLKRGLPMSACPQNGYIQHVVGGDTYYIDVRAFDLIREQNIPDYVFIPVIRPQDPNLERTRPDILTLPRPKCERLLQSYEAYKITYFTKLRTVMRQVVDSRFPDYSTGITKNSLRIFLENEFVTFINQLTGSTTITNIQSLDDVDWVKLW